MSLQTPSALQIANAIDFFSCRQSNYQPIEIWFNLGVLMAGSASGGLSNTVKIDQNDPNNVVKIGGTVRALSSTDVSTGAGATIPAGAKSIAFSFSSDFTGTVNGSNPVLTGQSSKTINAPVGDTLPAIIYTRSAGVITIDILT